MITPLSLVTYLVMERSSVVVNGFPRRQAKEYGFAWTTRTMPMSGLR